MAVNAVKTKQVSVALACRTFQISETCYRYERKLSDANAEIVDWLVKLTTGEFRSEVQHRGQIWYLSDAQRETVSPCRTIRISRPAREIRSLP